MSAVGTWKMIADKPSLGNDFIAEHNKLLAEVLLSCYNSTINAAVFVCPKKY